MLSACLVSMVQLRSFFHKPDRGDRRLRVSGRLRVAAEAGAAGHRVRRQKSADEWGRQAAQDELTANGEQARLGEIGHESEALAVAAKGDPAELDLRIEVLPRAILRRAEAGAQSATARRFASTTFPSSGRDRTLQNEKKRSASVWEWLEARPRSRRTSRRRAPAVRGCCAERRYLRRSAWRRTSRMPRMRSASRRATKRRLQPIASCHRGIQPIAGASGYGCRDGPRFR